MGDYQKAPQLFERERERIRCLIFPMVPLRSSGYWDPNSLKNRSEREREGRKLYIYIYMYNIHTYIYARKKETKKTKIKNKERKRPLEAAVAWWSCCPPFFSAQGVPRRLRGFRVFRVFRV